MSKEILVEHDGYINQDGEIKKEQSARKEKYTNAFSVKAGDVVDIILEYSINRAMRVLYAFYDEDNDPIVVEPTKVICDKTTNHFSYSVTIPAGVYFIRFSFYGYDDYEFKIYFIESDPTPIKNIPAIKIGNEVYEIKDLAAREHMIEVRKTQPDSDDNKVWIKETEDEKPIITQIGNTDDYRVDLGEYRYVNDGSIQYKNTDGRYVGVHVVAERATSELIADLRHEEARLRGTLEGLIVWKKEKGQPNGVATLDGDGLIPSTQLPSYVDDVLEGYVKPEDRRHITTFYKTREGTSPNYTYKDPYTPEFDKIYVNLDKDSVFDYNRIYRWSGTVYVEVSNPKDAIHDRDADLTEEDKYNYTWSIHRLTNEYTADRDRIKAIEDSVGAANGIATLDANTKVPIDQLQNAISDNETVTNKTWSSYKIDDEFDDDRDRIKAIEDSVGAANGIATLDANTKVPIDQLQNVISDNETVTNKTWSSYKIDDELDDDRDRISAIEDSVGAASGIASLDSNTMVPIDQLQNAISDNETVTNKTWSSYKIDDELDDDRDRIKAIEDAIGASDGIATLDENTKVPVDQLQNLIGDSSTATNKTWSANKLNTEYVSDRNRIKALEDAKGAASGIATLDSSGKLNNTQLPLGTTSTTAFAGDKGQSAYTHAVTNKGAQFASGLYKITTNGEGHVTAATAVAKADITGLGIPGSDTVTTVDYDSDNKKITKTVSGTTTDVVAVSTLKTDMALGNVENKSASTILGEMTSSNVTTALGYTPASDTAPTFNTSITIGSTTLSEADLISLLALLSNQS